MKVFRVAYEDSGQKGRPAEHEGHQLYQGRVITRQPQEGRTVTQDRNISLEVRQGNVGIHRRSESLEDPVDGPNQLLAIQFRTDNLLKVAIRFGRRTEAVPRVEFRKVSRIHPGREQKIPGLNGHKD